MNEVGYDETKFLIWLLDTKNVKKFTFSLQPI